VIDFNFENDAEPTKGSLLISEPFLNDQYFSRSVIFLCDHNEQGSFGFVLNNYIDAELHDIVGELPDIQTRISVGGPVDTSNLFFVHALGDEVPDSLEIIDGLYIGGRFEVVKSLIAENPEKAKKIRFFIGYSGWDAEQLQSEMEEKSWIVLNSVKQSTVLDTKNDDIWQSIMRDLGGKFKVMSEFPKNPSDN